jgi:hypothetical protein
MPGADATELETRLQELLGQYRDMLVMEPL